MPVAARFHELRDRVVATVDMKFAEAVRLTFMKGAAPDPAKPQITIDAVLRTGNEKSASIASSNSRTWRSKIAAGQAELHIDRTVYPDIVLQKLDTVRAMARPGKPAFEVLSVNDRDHSRLIIGLGQK